ncbi:MAG: YraN family protein [Pseudomonadota bacterium]
MPFDALLQNPAAPSRARRARDGRRSGAVGRGGEMATARWYAREGWREVARNWRAGREHGGGEIDLILRRGDLLAFVEVKTRRTLAAAAYAMSPAQRRRIEAAALRFMELEGAANLDMRFDVVLLDRCGSIEVIDNAFFE